MSSQRTIHFSPTNGVVTAKAAARLLDLKARARMAPHGTRARYIASRCRCMLCRAANSRCQCARYRAKRSGETNPLVDPARARQHIMALSEAGVGYKSVADAAAVSRTIVAEIRTGTREHIRRSTEERILAVDVSAATGKALIDSRSTWKLLDELLGRGFSKRQLAKWMGYAGVGAIQFKRGAKITASNAARVRKMYELLKQGKLRRVE